MTDDTEPTYIAMHTDEMLRLWAIEDAAVHFFTLYRDFLGMNEVNRHIPGRTPVVRLLCDTAEHQALMIGALKELRKAMDMKSPDYPTGELKTIN